MSRYDDDKTNILIVAVFLGWFLAAAIGVNFLTVNAHYTALKTVCTANAVGER